MEKSMKPRIAPEIDDLMWNVAESADSQAIEQFGERYPEYRPELGKRLALLRTMRASRPNAPSPRPLRLPNGRPAPAWQRFAVACAAICVAMIGFAGVVYVAKTTAPFPKPVANVEPIVTRPFDASNPTIRKTVPLDEEYHRFAPSNDPNRIQPVRDANPWEKPITVKFDRVALVDALQAIAVQGQLEIEIAPNMPQVEIGFAFERNRPIEILEALGVQHGFSVLIQGPGHVLIVPETKFIDLPNDPDLTLEPTGETPAIDPPELSKPTNSGA